ncbi:ThuA domain-containing protein [Microbacterium sp. JZ70]
MTPKPIRTLIVTGMTDVHHDWRKTTPALVALLESTGRFDVRVSEEFRGATAETLRPYDLVVLNYYGRRDPWRDVPEERFGEETERALFDFVASGKGLVAYHPTLAGGVGWHPEYERLLGGVMREDTSRRAPNNDFLLRTAEAHPITDGWPAEFPHYGDDLYVGLRWPEGVRKTILLTGWDNRCATPRCPPSGARCRAWARSTPSPGRSSTAQAARPRSASATTSRRSGTPRSARSSREPPSGRRRGR